MDNNRVDENIKTIGIFISRIKTYLGTALTSLKTAREKRSNNYWEPIFAPQRVFSMKTFNWKAAKDQTYTEFLCTAENLKNALPGTEAFQARECNFESCDFGGDFDSCFMTFANCRFDDCDFGYSTWRNAKFSRCHFFRCSFSLAKFENCQFLDCKWADIGMSGNETKFSNTVITNPDEFLSAAYTNQDPEILKKNSTNPPYQRMRLEQTKLKIGRLLLNNMSTVGDDKAYYASIKAYLMQVVREKEWVAKHRFSELKNGGMSFGVLSLLVWNYIQAIFFTGERLLLSISGAVNGWGESILRPALLGVALMIFFACIYVLTFQKESIYENLMRSFDVTLLIGYTKQASNKDEFLVQAIYAINALLGLWWYAIFVPTVVNRISRVR